MYKIKRKILLITILLCILFGQVYASVPIIEMNSIDTGAAFLLIFLASCSNMLNELDSLTLGEGYTFPVNIEGGTTTYGTVLDIDNDGIIDSIDLDGDPTTTEFTILSFQDGIYNIDADLDGVVDFYMHVDSNGIVKMDSSINGSGSPVTFTEDAEGLISWVILDDQFITTWEITVANEFITIPLDSTGSYNFDINWGDDSSDDSIITFDQAELTHTYSSIGTYTVTITGLIEGFGFANVGGTPVNLIDIVQWGKVELHNNGSQFQGTGLTSLTATGFPEVTNMTGMFQATSTFNSDISGWDVSGVTDMSNLFKGAIVFDQDISSWDVSGVTGMRNMFSSAVLFNQNLNSWDVSNVLDMDHMFSRASAFNGDITDWDVSSVTDMDVMFGYSYPSSFNQDISGWDVSNVTYMEEMFYDATEFNQDLSSWVVSQIDVEYYEYFASGWGGSEEFLPDSFDSSYSSY